MRSKIPERKLHVALFPSLYTLYRAGAKDELVSYIHGTFSYVPHQTKVAHKSPYIRDYFNRTEVSVVVLWRQKNGEKPATIGEIYESLQDNGVPELAIKEITIVTPIKEWSQYKLDYIETFERWEFSTFTFKKGTWKRLRAETFPAQKLYQVYMETRREIFKEYEVGLEIRKRWRDVILINHPVNRENWEIRSIWSHKPYALILKEDRGEFSLADFYLYEKE